MQLSDVLFYAHQDAFCSYILFPSTHISSESSVLLHFSKAPFCLDTPIHPHEGGIVVGFSIAVALTAYIELLVVFFELSQIGFQCLDAFWQ